MSIITDVIKAAALLTKIALSAYSKEKNSVPYTPPTDSEKPPRPLHIERYTDRERNLNLVLNAVGNEYRAVIYQIETQDIIIPESYNGLPVTEIKLECFSEHENKARLFVPKTVKKLDLFAVLHMKGYTKEGRWIKVIIDEENPYFVTENRCVYSKDMTVLWCTQCKTNYFTVPDTVTAIADHAFTGNQHIVEVRLPPSVKEIGNGAFYQCGNLRKINVENVISIGKEAFRCCKKIRDFICEKLRDIGDRCFEECRDLDTVKLPAALTKVGSGVFPEVMFITFYDNLKAPLRSFANIPYYVTVRSAKSGEIKYKVFIERDVPKIFKERYLLGWREYAEFNFEEFDKLFKNYCSKNRVSDNFFWITAQLRLGYPYKLSESAREYYKKFLIDNPGSAEWQFFREWDIGDFSGLCREKIKRIPDVAKLIYVLDMLPGNERKLKEYRLDEKKTAELKEKIFLMIEEFCRDGVYGVDDLYELIDIFSANGRPEYTARIMELRNSMFPYEDRLLLE